MTVVSEPGVYDDLDETVYHAHPALSNSDAKLLLAPSCPAKYRYAKDHGRKPKREFDLGKAGHNKVLGAGPQLVVVLKTDRKTGEVSEADNYNTNSAQDHRDAIRATGGVPLLRKELDQVEQMAKALREHPIAAALFDQAHGQPEQSLFWTDAETGVACRARADWLRHLGPGRVIVPDYKTCDRADKESLRRDVWDYGYYRQAAWYLDGLRALGRADDDAAFVFVAQEKEPPYLVNIIELDADALAAGRDVNRRAREVFRDCTASGVWPGYSTDIELISLPRYATYQLEEYAA